MKIAASPSQLEIDAGETIEAELRWENADGTPRNMRAAAVSVTLRRTYYNLVVPDTLTASAQSLKLGQAASAALAPGEYLVQIWEKRAEQGAAACADVVLVVH